MDHLSKRAFSFVFVLFVFAVLVSSATDDATSTKDKTSNGNHPADVASVSKVNQSPSKETDDASKATNMTSPKKPATATETVESKNCTDGINGTECEDNRSFVTKFWDKMSDNRDMLFRTMYVLLGVTGIVLLYFVVRAVRLRRRRNKSRKYGVITTRGDLEMEPLGQGDEEDEDYTVFEMNGRTK